MTYPATNIVNRSPGEFVDDADWDELVDALNFLANPPHVGLHHSTTQSHTNNGNWQAIVFDTETEDTASMHNTSSNTSRIVAPRAGLYLFTGGVDLAGNGTGTRALGFRKNSSGTNEANVRGWEATGDGLGASNTIGLSIAVPLKLAASDYVELVLFQNSGGNLQVNRHSSGDYPYFTATWIGNG